MMPLGWGLEKEDFLKELPYCTIFAENDPYRQYVCIKQTADKDTWAQQLILRNFQGDCGTLYMGSANYANELGLERIKEVASKNGFDTVLATVVMQDSTKQKEIFLAAGWTLAVESTSNRKKGKSDKLVFVLHIKDCDFKGYYND